MGLSIPVIGSSCKNKITWVTINLWSEKHDHVLCMDLCLSREAAIDEAAIDRLSAISGWKTDRATRYIYLKIEMLVSCKQMKTQPVIWKVCSYLWISFQKRGTDIKPSDRFKNNWWCPFFSLLGQIRVALAKETIGISINHPNHPLCPGLVFWTAVRMLV